MHTLDEAVGTILSSSRVPIHRGGKNLIDDRYFTILTAAFDESRMSVENLGRMKIVLETVICAQVPMTLDVLVGLLGLKTLNQANALLQPLRSVLNVIEATGLVTTLHASFPDYMLTQDRSGAFHCMPEMRHLALAKSCLQMIDQVEPKFNICALTSSYVSDNEVEDLNVRVIQAISPGLMYASQYWSAHLGLGAFQNEFVTIIHRFLSENLLIWMEILNLTKNMRLGTNIIRQVEKWCSEQFVPSDVMRIARDAGQFVSVYVANPVCQSTPHIYVSMLAFWPRSRPVSVAYEPKTRGMRSPKVSAIDRRQLVLLATWKVSSDPAYSLSLTPDGARIAAATRVSIDLLDTSTGDGVIHIQGPETMGVQAIAMSPDGTRITLLLQGHSQGLNYTLKSSIQTEMIEEVLKPTPTVLCIAFSPDGSQIAFGLSGGNIHVYPSQKGDRVLDPLGGHTGEVSSIYFSPNGLFLASGSYDGTIRVWDAKSGQTVGNPFQGHTGYVLSVSYSPDGARLASASSNSTIQVWDPLTGQTVLSPLNKHSDWVRTVTISPDDALIASGSNDKTIRVYDAHTDQTVH
ncbi:hypothetical protein RSAG8_06377, partial [Rhizoctonia solani AG-8 WAC10335]